MKEVLLGVGSPAGFTLIELLVAIGIIALLIGILLPVLGGARDSARQAQDLSNLRQLMLGHTLYQQDHNGHVLWGLTPPKVNDKFVQVDTGLYPSPFGPPIADRFPWRFAPYVENVWEVLYSHRPLPPLPQASDTPFEAFNKAYGLSLEVTYALNTVYVGGHSGQFLGFYNGTDPTAQGDIPNVGAHPVFFEKEVRDPSSLLVFTEVQGRLGDGPSQFSRELEGGMFWATPPFAKGARWDIVSGQVRNLNAGLNQGLPIGRHGTSTPTAYFDGHASLETPEVLFDMRRWFNGATSPTQDPIP
ncbi:MAG: prepilin-type N-terminal cleavage/methylation domain-containing protein [Planctomycetota bacterium]